MKLAVRPHLAAASIAVVSSFAGRTLDAGLRLPSNSQSPQPTDFGGAQYTIVWEDFSICERPPHKEFCDALDSLSSLPDHSRASMAFPRKSQTRVRRDISQEDPPGSFNF